MAGNVGRNTIFKKGGTRIAGVVSGSIDWSADYPEGTSGEDGGYRTYIDHVGEQRIDCSLELVMKDHVFNDLGLSEGTSRLLTDITIEQAIINPANTTPSTISGNFLFDSISITNQKEERITFSITLKSSGAFTKTVEAV